MGDDIEPYPNLTDDGYVKSTTRERSTLSHSNGEALCHCTAVTGLPQGRRFFFFGKQGGEF